MRSQRAQLFSAGILMVAIVATTALAFEAPLFPNPIIPGSNEPWTLAVGDFDEDGRNDLVVPGAGSTSATVLLANGDGTFRRGTAPLSLAHGCTVADFDEDNNLDIACADGGTGALLVLGQGDGTFVPGTFVATTGSFSTAVVAGDFDEDTHQDLLIGFFNTHALALLTGNGDGTFAAPVDIGNPQVLTLAAVDLNSDTHLDLITADPAAGVSVRIRLGNGDGTFVDGAGLAGGDSPGAYVIDDFDGDTNLDLGVANSNSDDMSVFLGNGDGTFGVETRYAAGNQPFSISFADLDDDGAGDLVVGNNLDRFVSIYFGNGNGTFAAESRLDTVHTSGPLHIEDLDGDGRLDLTIGSYFWGTVNVLLGHGDGSFPLPVGTIESIPAANSVVRTAAGDFDENGLLDLALIHDPSSPPDGISIVVADGSGGFLLADTDIPGTDPSDLAIADFDNDTHLDVAVTNLTSNNGSIFLGVGDGTLDPEMPLALPRQPIAVAAGRFDGDAMPDLAVVSVFPSNTIRTTLSDGDGTFSGGVIHPITAPGSLTSGDFNEDGNVDLVRAGDARLMLGNGDGSFGPEIALGVNVPRFVTADVDLDGHLDLVAHGMELLLGNGDGTFAAPASIDMDAANSFAAVGDLNGDGRNDLVAAGTSLFGVRLALAGGGYAPPEFFATLSRSARGLFVSDADADGSEDLIVPSTGSVTVSLNRGTTTFGFSDPTTMKWPPLSGALSYNVYRGLIADLVDGDFDGLPDLGYGICVSTPDPDPTDGEFVDATVPATGSGFYYLAAVVDWEGERDLGATSAGLPRLTAGVCP